MSELFEIVANPRRHGELDGSGTVLDAVSGPARLTPNATFSVKMKQRGVPYRITSKVTEFADGRVVEWRHPMGHRWRWEFAPQSAQATLVTETFDYSKVNPVKARLYDVLGLPRQNAAGIDASLTKLQSRYPDAG